MKKLLETNKIMDKNSKAQQERMVKLEEQIREMKGAAKPLSKNQSAKPVPSEESQRSVSPPMGTDLEKIEKSGTKAMRAIELWRMKKTKDQRMLVLQKKMFDKNI